MADDELLARVRGGDTEALATFLEERRKPLLAYIERQIGAALRRKVEPEDILQEVSADAVRSLADVQLGDRDPFSWLCQIAERRIIDAHRHFFGAAKRDAGREVPLAGGRDSQSPGLIDMLAASFTTPSAVFSRNVRQARLLDALQQLPEDQREALRLRYMENLASKEIAERIGKSDAAVRVMLSRAIKRLEAMLSEEVG